MKADERAVDVTQCIGHMLILSEDIAERSKGSVTGLPNPSVAGRNVERTKMAGRQRHVTPERCENGEGTDVNDEGDAAKDKQYPSPCRSVSKSGLFIAVHSEEKRATPNDPKLSDGGGWRGPCPTVERRKDEQ